MRDDLHPALSGLLLETPTEVHGRACLFKSFLYRYLPFWMASLENCILIVFVPMVLVLIPGLRSILAVSRWRMKMRIYRWYRVLLALEQDLIAHLAPEKQGELIEWLNLIKEEVNKMKVPVSFADQFYVLHRHISFVRDRLIGNTQSHYGNMEK